ncbi:hypothetical protein Rain11_2642 [Raineya orbicola]|jgi:hypothetical protein|uniref:Uncharacterized protein n=1 Tax=Raineya orbicola TaxID=2016530 RepID=A0A2N3I1D5_9BACT|nr:hypothetical protein Rain11_2642 [Raineya orbicola]
MKSLKIEEITIGEKLSLCGGFSECLEFSTFEISLELLTNKRCYNVNCTQNCEKTNNPKDTIQKEKKEKKEKPQKKKTNTLICVNPC